ncbi:MAG: molybdopterin-dependent oxidoreductase [Chloroflexi bacterium]|nr:molybdopterin-dependent oxidoreductase [Chloroflexota bacterium]
MLKRILGRSEEEKKIREQGRLPPGQSLTQKFPVLHYGAVPTFDPLTWNLKAWGEIEEKVEWSWDEFQALPRIKLKLDIHCVTRWSKVDTEWEGVSLASLINSGMITPKPSAKFILQHCENGFTVNLPLEVALGENFLLATHFDGEPLTAEHGHPLRGVIGAIPGRDDLMAPYFWKGGKWLRGLEFMVEDRRGFWEQAGYHNEADIWKEQRMVYSW